MKRWILLALIVVVAVPAFGCKEKKPRPGTSINVDVNR